MEVTKKNIPWIDMPKKDVTLVELMCETDTKCKKVDGYQILYDESKVYIGNIETEVPGSISYIQVIELGYQSKAIKITTGQGIYYYDWNMKYLLGPIQSDRIDEISRESCYVYEEVAGKIVQVFYICLKDDGEYAVCHIACKEGITVELRANMYFGQKLKFFITDKDVYVLKPKKVKFEAVFQNVDIDNYQTYFFNNDSNKVGFIGYKKGKVFYGVEVDLQHPDIQMEGTIDVISEKDCIYKIGDKIIVIDERYNCVLFTKQGKDCYKKKIEVSDRGEIRIKEVYVVEVDEHTIALYNEAGDKVWCDNL